ncbi:MAG: TolC family protein [Candidatus Brocadiaceae bacterium]
MLTIKILTMCKTIRTISGIILCLLLITVISGGTIFAQKPETGKEEDVAKSLPILTVDQAINEALRNNLGLQAEQMNIQIAESSVTTARLRPNPTLSLGDSYLAYFGGYSLDRGANPSEVATRIDVPVERGGKRKLRIETAEYNKKIVNAQLLDSIRRLKLEVTTSCIDVLRAKSNLALALDNLRTFEELVRINDARVKAGAINPQDLTRSQVAMHQFQSTVKRAELDLSNAKIKLQSLLGRKKISDIFDIQGELKVTVKNPNLEFNTLQETAFSSRPDLNALELTEEQSQSALKLQQANAKVDYSVGVQYQRTFASDDFNSMGLSLSVPLPVFSRNQGEIARVHAERERLLRQKEAVKAQVLNEAKTAYNEFTTGLELVNSIERNLLKPAEQARDTAAYIYRTGASSLIEFLDAQRAFNETMQSYYEALATYQNAINNLNAAVGKEVIK